MKLQPALIFGESMVLQRNKPIPVWGRSVRGDEITVTLGEVTRTVQAGDHYQNEEEISGNWCVIFPPMEACEETSLTIRSLRTGESLSFSHVAVGEVWLAGGQSNMEFLLKYDSQFEEVLEDPDDEQFRFFRYPQANFAGCLEKDNYPDDGFWRRWTTPEDRGFFSGPAAYMGRQLRKVLKVPVGIIGCNWGGSSAAGWTELSAIQQNPALSSILDWQKNIVDSLDYKKYMEASELPAAENSLQAQEGMDRFMMGIGLLEFFKNMPEEMPPVTYTPYLYGPRSINAPGQLFEHMLKKVAPYALRGFIWYQGEEDDMVERQFIYGELMKTLILSWRKLWKEDLPFLQVELAPYHGPAERVAAKDWPEMRRQQHRVTKELKDVHDICIMDSGHPYNIHVRKKKPVGERLALLARKYVYGEPNLLADSPELSQAERNGDEIILTFAGTGNGLALIEKPEEKGALEDVVSIEADGKKAQAEISIRDSRMILKSPAFRKAREIEIRFCELDYCTDPLFGSTGLPVFPFTVRV